MHDCPFTQCTPPKPKLNEDGADIVTGKRKRVKKTPQFLELKQKAPPKGPPKPKVVKEVDLALS